MEPVRSWGTEESLGQRWLNRVTDYAVQVGEKLNPEWALRRARAAAIHEELQGYRNSIPSRISSRTSPAAEGRADFFLEVGYDRRRLVDRARKLERDSVIADALLSRATENVVGSGFTLRCQTEDEVWNENTEAAWNAWCNDFADVRGMATFSELLALTYRSWLRDGDVGAIKLADGCIQFVESDQIANPQGQIPTTGHVDGINLDERGRPTSYLIVKKPDPQWAAVRFGQKFTEVPAKDVLFLARRSRHGQTRGLSAFSNISWLLDQIDGHIEAVTVAARMAACVGLVIERQNRMSGLNTMIDGEGNSRRKLRLEPGMIGEVGAGDKITQVDPKQPGSTFSDLLTTLGRLVGLSFGLPLEVSFLDFSKTNYSSARAALLQAHKVWGTHQGMMGRFATKIFQWWLLREMKAGRIPPRADALKHDWIMPGWKWVDPEKELNADLAAVDAGVMTLADLAEKQGKDLVKLLERRAQEIKLKEKLGIPEVRSKMTRDYVDPIELAEASRPAPGEAPGEAPSKKDESEDDEEE